MVLHSSKEKFHLFIKAAAMFYGEETAKAIYTFSDRVCKYSFNYKITPDIPIILTTTMTAYNRFSGQYVPSADTIEIVRHHCCPKNGYIKPIKLEPLLMTLAHELCHVYQYKVLGGSTGSRGPHRCKSWFESIIKASPYVCGVDISKICKPLKSIRIKDKVKKVPNNNSLSESEITHWPSSILELVQKKDKRVAPYICSDPIFNKV